MMNKNNNQPLVRQLLSLVILGILFGYFYLSSQENAIQIINQEPANYRRTSESTIEKVQEGPCNVLLEKGQLINDKWQPEGCNFHKYSKNEARKCLLKRYQSSNKTNTFAYFGDSKTRDLYDAMRGLFRGRYVRENVQKDLSYTDRAIHLKMNFYWSKHVDIDRINHFKRIANDIKNNKSAVPQLMVNGGGVLWLIHEMEGDPQSLPDYEDRLRVLKPYVEKLKDTKKSVWLLQEPFIKHKFHERRHELFDNITIQDYNDVTLEVIGNTPVHFWKSLIDVHYSQSDPATDGVHIKPAALSLNTQILFNWYCNAYMGFDAEKNMCCATKF